MHLTICCYLNIWLTLKYMGVQFLNDSFLLDFRIIQSLKFFPIDVLLMKQRIVFIYSFTLRPQKRKPQTRESLSSIQVPYVLRNGNQGLCPLYVYLNEVIYMFSGYYKEFVQSNQGAQKGTIPNLSFYSSSGCIKIAKVHYCGLIISITLWNDGCLSINSQ